MITESLIVFYFALLIWSARTVYRSWDWRSAALPARQDAKNDVKSLAVVRLASRLVLLSLFAFAVTWYYIAKYMYAEINRFPTWEDFNEGGGSLFFGAYRAVVDTKGKWFFSSSLLTYVLVSTPFVIREGDTMGLTKSQTFAYVMLGFLGAISLSQALFFAHSLGHREKLRGNGVAASPVMSKGVSWILVVCALLAMHSIVMLEKTWRTTREFEAHLLIVHFILALPTLVGLPSSSSSSSSFFALKIGDGRHDARLAWSLYRLLIGAFALPFHLMNLLTVMTEGGGGGPHRLFTDFLDNPCSLSITIDVILSTIVTGMYVFGRRQIDDDDVDDAERWIVSRVTGNKVFIPLAKERTKQSRWLHEGDAETAKFVLRFATWSFLASPAVTAGWGVL